MSASLKEITHATLIRHLLSCDSQQLMRNVVGRISVQLTKLRTVCLVVWPTVSCFADWSKRRDVTFVITECWTVDYSTFLNVELSRDVNAHQLGWRLMFNLSGLQVFLWPLLTLWLTIYQCDHGWLLTVWLPGYLCGYGLLLTVRLPVYLCGWLCTVKVSSSWTSSRFKDSDNSHRHVVGISHFASLWKPWIFVVVVVASVLWHCWLGGRKGIRPVKN